MPLMPPMPPKATGVATVVGLFPLDTDVVRLVDRRHEDIGVGGGCNEEDADVTNAAV